MNAVEKMVIAGVPSNIRLPEGSRAIAVESDLHDIASRVREVSPRLTVSLLETPKGAVWAITELCEDGEEKLVFRVGAGCEIDALDGRVIQRLQYLQHVPVKERVAELEKQLARDAAARDEEEQERIYSTLGEKMYDNLFSCGFVHTPKPMSVRPMNRAARRAGRKA